MAWLAPAPAFWLIASMIVVSAIAFAIVPPVTIALPVGLVVAILGVFRMLMLSRDDARFVAMTRNTDRPGSAFWSWLGETYAARVNHLVAVALFLIAAILIIRSVLH